MFLAEPRTRVRAAKRPKLAYGAIVIALAAALVPSVALAVRAAPPDVFPSLISLPTGFQPEGVATGRGTALYAGSLVDGAIYRADFRSGGAFVRG